jgi:hypothetical protein
MKTSFNSAVSTIEIKGKTNQLPINNNVSLRFEGVANTTIINSPKSPQATSLLSLDEQ